MFKKNLTKNGPYRDGIFGVVSSSSMTQILHPSFFKISGYLFGILCCDPIANSSELSIRLNYAELLVQCSNSFGNSFGNSSESTHSHLKKFTIGLSEISTTTFFQQISSVFFPEFPTDSSEELNKNSAKIFPEIS